MSWGAELFGVDIVACESLNQAVDLALGAGELLVDQSETLRSAPDVGDSGFDRPRGDGYRRSAQ